MSRLNKEARRDIANTCIVKQFKDKEEKISQKEEALALKLYKSAFDSKVLLAAKKMPANWLRMDSCLRFNCGGYDVRFKIKEAVPVPHSTGCMRLANITGDLAAEAQDFLKEKEAHDEERRRAYRALESMLENMHTTQQLEKTWPEGKEFYSKYVESVEGTTLPAVQIKELNAMLGIKAA